MGVRIVDKANQFKAASAKQLDSALERMANDILTIAKVKVPLKSGNLQDQMTTKKVGVQHHQVRVDEDYAGYQERGMRKDGTRVVRRYSTPGTGKNFLKGAGAQVAPRALQYLKQTASRANV